MTFRKRSEGILKKAHEISVLCESDVALLFFKPDGTLIQFSNRKNIDDVIQRYSSIGDVTESRTNVDVGFAFRSISLLRR